MTDWAIEISPTGSRYICDPPVLDTDEDFIVLVKDINEANTVLTKQGFLAAGSLPGPNFTSYKRESVNYIVTEKEGFFNKFKLATRCAKWFNLTSKTDRIKLFQAILYGADYNQVEIKIKKESNG